MSVAAIPALRGDLEVELRPDGQVDVRDPRLFNLFTLDASYLDIAKHFDGERDAKAISEVLADEEGVVSNAREVKQIASELESLLLLDTPSSAEATPSSDNIAPHSLLEGVRKKLRVLPDIVPESNWSCRACGACCHGLAVELTEEEESRIDVSLYQDILGEESFAVDALIDPEEPAKRILRQRAEDNKACIFLGEDGLCSIHARQGPEAKPDACQVFPYVVVHVPQGKPRLTMRTNCHSMHESWEDGDTADSAIPDVKRLLQTHDSLKIPKSMTMFGREKDWEQVQKVYDRVGELLLTEGVTPYSLEEIDNKYLRGRLAKSRERFGESLLEYLKEEAKGPVPVEEGSLREQFKLLPRSKAALEAMMRGEEAPETSVPVSAFLARQAQLALYGFGPLNIPDAGIGLVMLMLALEACLHAVGPRGKEQKANLAFMVYAAPLLEVSIHAWPIMEAIDPRYTKNLRKEYIAMYS